MEKTESRGMVPDFSLVLHEGIAGRRKKMEIQGREEMPLSCKPEKIVFAQQRLPWISVCITDTPK